MTDGIILAGGRASRLGGRDKALLLIGGRSLLSLAVEAVSGLEHVVVVGPERSESVGRPVLWAREDPPFAGPVAALGAGLAALPPTGADLDHSAVVLLAADLPHAGDLVTALLREPPAAGRGRVVVDATSRPQWTAGLYPRDVLEVALSALATPVNASLHRLMAAVPWDPVTVDPHVVRDVDTPSDAVALGATEPDPETEENP